MLFETTFSANSVPGFPLKTLCLTFDDGPGETDSPPTEPGPHSLELAQYLASQGVQATFFMVGRQMQEFPGIAAEISALGHQVGAHTYDHVGMDEYLTAKGDVVRQMALTSALLPADAGQPVYFRAPYGQWSPAVAQALNADLMTCLTCFGPIHWDNAATDWDKWLNGISPDVAAQGYLDDINTMGKGVILMHDCTANNNVLKKKNRAVELVQILVPQLKNAGYNMVRVDAIPGIASQAPPPDVALRGANQMYISAQGSGGGQVLVSGVAPASWERLTPVPLGSNRVAFRVPMGQYLSVQDTGGNPVTATATAIGDWETFDVEPCNGKVSFRTYTGDFLTVAADSSLGGNAGQSDPNAAFSLFVYERAAAMGAGDPVTP